MKSNIFTYILSRAKRTILLPFYKYFYKLKKLSNVKVVLSKLLFNITSTLKSLLSLRPEKASDYFYIGRIGIYKKLVFVLLLLLCIAPIVYFEFISPLPVVPEEVTAFRRFKYNDPALESFTGTAIILSTDDKVVYDGYIEKGVCTGTGKLYDLNGNLVYIGKFKNNEFDGKGKLFYPSGRLKYEGEFQANQFNGQGTLYNPNATVQYTGTFLNGMKHGQGKLYDATGTRLIYEGSFAEDLYNGEGILYGKNGSPLYIGTFKNGLYDGEGTLNDPVTARPIYKGQFENGYFSGIGTLYSSSGRQRYTGPFFKGSIDYAYFIDSPSSELSNHFFGTPVVDILGNKTVISYPDMNVSFFIEDGILAETGEESLIDSLMVYDGMLPAGLQKGMSSSDFEERLGASIMYEGYTYVLPKDLIALKALAENGILTEGNEIYNLIDQLDTTTVLSGMPALYPEIKLYLLCYDAYGFALTLFYDDISGKFLYYTWDL